MTDDWYLDRLIPGLAKVPTTLPWRVAGRLGDAPMRRRHVLSNWLAKQFGQVFPLATKSEHQNWAGAHLRMLAEEKVDAMAFHRLGRAGGPSIELKGAEHARALQQAGRGFILILNHFDRLLTAPIALAHQGIVTNVLTMPVLNNPELSRSQRQFLMAKIRGYTQATQGTWRTTDEGLRAVHESLRSGQAWVILADAWRPEFGRLRDHAFLGGRLSLPTGIERLAQSAGVPLLHAATYTDRPDRLKVCVDVLPDQPRLAIDAVVRRLEKDVIERPWAWWQWGLWDQMWRPQPLVP